MSGSSIAVDEDPSAESLAEIPEIDFGRVRSLGRGLYAGRVRGDAHVVRIEDDVWRAYGSAEAINEALRALLVAARHVQRQA